MKEVEESKLVIGKKYCDLKNLDADYATVLKYIGVVDGFICFKYISGDKGYIENEQGLIDMIMMEGKNQETFFELKDQTS